VPGKDGGDIRNHRLGHYTISIRIGRRLGSHAQKSRLRAKRNGHRICNAPSVKSSGALGLREHRGAIGQARFGRSGVVMRAPIWRVRAIPATRTSLLKRYATLNRDVSSALLRKSGSAITAPIPSDPAIGRRIGRVEFGIQPRGHPVLVLAVTQYAMLRLQPSTITTSALTADFARVCGDLARACSFRRVRVLATRVGSNPHLAELPFHLA
jgi:hypothetical protein